MTERLREFIISPCNRANGGSLAIEGRALKLPLRQAWQGREMRCSENICYFSSRSSICFHALTRGGGSLAKSSLSNSCCSLDAYLDVLLKIVLLCNRSNL